MKVKASLKSAKARDKENSYVAKRGKRIYLYNRKKPRLKTRQGN